MLRHRQGRIALVILLAAFLSSCTTGRPADPAGSGGNAPSAQPVRYSTVAELGGAIRAQQLIDKTVSYTYKMTADRESFDGQGVFHVDRTGTNSREHFQGGINNLDFVVIGSEVFGRDFNKPGTGGSGKPWSKTTLKEDVGNGGFNGIMFPDTVWATQLDGVAEAFTLSGVSDAQRVGAPAVEYRLTTDLVQLRDRTASHLRADLKPTQSAVSATPAELDLVVGYDNRLLEAHWNVTGNDSVLNLAYTFADWGAPVDIMPPPADQIG